MAGNKYYMHQLIGRETEIDILQHALKSESAELIAIFGRRRVGKTFLVRQYLKKHLQFELTGIREAKLSAQLNNFSKSLANASGNKKLYQTPTNWPDAFEQLNVFLMPALAEGKKVVFFDEFPWLSTHKSGFLAAFDHWWNTWGTRQNNLIVIICGSAASWMIRNIVNNRGGLHNRITRKIRLLPFTLQETEKYFQTLNIRMDRYQILQLYMTIGGIPHYLKEVRRGESASQAIDRICFRKDGLLQGEFKNLYHSLFDDANRHMAVVRLLARNNQGMTRTALLENTGLRSGGTLTLLLEELIESGFVTAWSPYDRKSRDSIYKLSDEFTHFYLKFMDRKSQANWQQYADTASWRSWSGIAFERVCLKHIDQLKKALGISGVQTETSAWRHVDKNSSGTQIDLLIDRKDFVINLCEMKFSQTEFIIDKAYAKQLENKRSIFSQQVKTKKSILLTMVTTFGLKENEYSEKLIHQELTMNALFD